MKPFGTRGSVFGKHHFHITLASFTEFDRRRPGVGLSPADALGGDLGADILSEQPHHRIPRLLRLHDGLRPTSQQLQVINNVLIMQIERLKRQNKKTETTKKSLRLSVHVIDVLVLRGRNKFGWHGISTVSLETS